MPTGSVQFYLNGEPITVPAQLDANGVATKAPLPEVQAGSYTITATYASSSDSWQNSTAAPVDFVMRSRVPTTLVITPPPSPSLYKQPVPISATVSSADSSVTAVPTGSVQFYLDGQPITVPANVDANGVATKASLPGVSPGTHTITATFTSSDPGFANGDDQPWATSSATPVDFVVRSDVPTSVVIAAPPSPMLFGTPVPISATVSSADASDPGVPTGSVQFYLNGQPISVPAPVEANGVATKASLPEVPAGSYTITATFTANDPSVPAGSPQPWADSTAAPVRFVMRSKVPTTIVITPPPSPLLFGQPVPISATVSSADSTVSAVPTGTVQFYLNGEPISVPAPVQADGVATKASLPSPPAGNYTITATFTSSDPGFASGDDQPWAASTATPVNFVMRSQVPTSIVITPPPTPLFYGQPVPVAATVSSADSTVSAVPTGTVQFYLNGQPISVPANVDASGLATKAALANLPVGRYTITAVFTSSDPGFASGDDRPWASSASTVTVNVLPAPTRLTAAPASKSSQVFTARLTRGYDGAAISGQTIAFKVRGLRGPITVCTATTSGDGLATCTGHVSRFILLFDSTYTATFAPTANYGGSNAKARLS